MTGTDLVEDSVVTWTLGAYKTRFTEFMDFRSQEGLLLGDGPYHISHHLVCRYLWTTVDWLPVINLAG